MRNYISVVLVMVFAGALMLSGCSNKGPAEEALKVAEQAVNGAKAEAAKIVPDQVKSLDAALNSAKEKFNKKEYKEAMAEAKAIPDKVKQVLDAAKAKKAELTKTWEELSQGLPKMVDAIKSRVDILSKSKKLPPTLPKEKFEEIKNGLGTVLTDWTGAQDSFKGGALAEAVTKAGSIKEKVMQFMEALGMSAPGAAPVAAPAKK